jgi:hypothetical protein
LAKRDRKVSKVLLAFKVQPVLLEPKVSKDVKALLVLKAFKVHRVHRVHKAVKAFKV